MKEAESKPGYVVLLDQLQSDQPGLFPQLSGKLTHVRIRAAKVMVYHFSDLTYSQEETLSVKSTFER